MRGWMLALLLVAVPAAAQTNTGQISGTIRDASGGVLPGVTVSVTNVNTCMCVAQPFPPSRETFRRTRRSLGGGGQGCSGHGQG